MGKSVPPRSLDKSSDDKKKRSYISQSDIPRHSLEEAINLGRALVEHFNGSTAPYQLAKAMEISPTSSLWQSLTGAAVAYGITEGGKNASVIRLATLGTRILTPHEEGDDEIAKREAALLPRCLREFFEKYNKGKFPKQAIGEKVLVTMGVPRERAKAVLEMAHQNGLFAGLIHETKGGSYVVLEPGMPKIEERLRF
jgi:hypothetical protein